MPYTTKWTGTGVEWVYTGTVTSKDILQSNLDIYGDERFDRLKYQLVDFTQAESFEVTDKEIKKVAYLDMAAARSNPNIKVAVVATQDVISKLAEAYAAYAEESTWETGVFNTLEEARQWLNVNCEKNRSIHRATGTTG